MESLTGPSRIIRMGEVKRHEEFGSVAIDPEIAVLVSVSGSANESTGADVECFESTAACAAITLPLDDQVFAERGNADPVGFDGAVLWVWRTGGAVEFAEVELGAERIIGEIERKDHLATCGCGHAAHPTAIMREFVK